MNHKSVKGPPTGGGQLSAEQVRRMEENRRKAKEKLASKRSLNHGSSNQGQPPAKRPALVNPQKSNAHMLPSTSYHGYKKYIPQTHSHPKSSNQSAPSTSTAQHLAHTTTVQPNRTHEKLSSNPHSNPSTSFQRTKSSHKPPPPKFSQLNAKIKANLLMISRTRFRVIVPYENTLIELFKKMPTKAYDAKTSTWSFGIEDYNTLVQAIQKECKHVELNLIPRPVLNRFLSSLQSKHMHQSHSSSSHCSHSSSDQSGMDWSRIGTKISATLMQFQRVGVEYSIKREGRVLIADDMGLGKTIQALAVMSYYRSDWPLLVICPSSVRLTWAEAFKRWIPSLTEDDINVILTTKGCGSFRLVNIISYDLLVKMSTEVQEKKFMAVIADESHFLKNYRTARCKAAIPVLKNARRAVLLSGTPALSRPMELYTQITSVDKNFRAVSNIQFGVRYCDGAKNQFGWDFSGASNMSELQMYLEDAIMIRRLKTEVLDQLPSKTREMVLLDLSTLKGGSREWKDLKKQLDEASKLKNLDRKNALLPLFDVTGKLKIPAVKDYILDLLEGDRKVIVFGHHLAVLDALCEALEKKSYHYIRIDGKTPADMRQAFCDQFQHDEKCLVAVLSITTANAGLTLTAASIVVFAELFWNPGILVQAEDRAYRIGQKSSVNVHYLVAKDTVDDFIWPLIQSKLSVLSQAGLAKDDFSTAESSVVTAKDATQKNLMDCFSALVSEYDLEQLSSFDDAPLELESK